MSANKISANLKILIVDDAKNVRTMLSKTLKDIGFKNIIEAENGIDALELLKKAVEKNNCYELVFSGLNMPEMDGMELLDEIAKFPILKRIPWFVISTDNNKEGLFVKVKMRGATDFITGPFDATKIKQKIIKNVLN